MLVTSEIPRTTIAEIQERLHQVNGMNVKLIDEAKIGDEHSEAIFEIEFNSLRYHLTILKPSGSDTPSIFKYWLFSAAGFNLWNPIAWFRWIAVERTKLRDLHSLLEDTIGLTPHLSGSPIESP